MMRRFWVHVVSIAVGFALACVTSAVAESADAFRVATFSCDVTPPLGQPLVSCDRLATVEQPLLAKGVVLESEGRRYVLCAVDWCELCNGAYDACRDAIAKAARVEPSHVAVQTVHQHTAPLVDSDAQKLLAEVGAANLKLDPKAFDAICRRLAAAVQESLARLEPFDRIGTGQAKVDRVASTRRPLGPDGKVIAVRYSVCIDPAVRALPEGKIDPWIKTITFARGEKPLVRLHYYATHPQTYYGDGRATSDMVGDAREELERKEGVFQVYFNGCGGDITLGKYNEGTKKDRAELASRLLKGMEASVAATKFAPASPIRWRTHPVLLPPRTDAGFSLDECLARTKNPKTPPVDRAERSAGCAAYHRRSRQPIELTSLEIGDVCVVHLPGEPMIDFQLFAQSVKPNAFVAVAGYGDCGTGYICTAKAFEEGGYEPTDCNVKPESETLLKKAISSLLGVE